jgi:uncharacterized protein YutE (UPF0331/DUF86 family)
VVREDIVRLKLAELEDRVSRIRTHQARDAEALAADRDALDIVAFNLMLAVQSCSDVAAHVIADEGWTAPASLADGFRRLAEHGVISAPTASAMRGAVRFRNVVAHGYAGLDVGAAHAASTAGLADLDAFAREVAAWLERRAQPPP